MVTILTNTIKTAAKAFQRYHLTKEYYFTNILLRLTPMIHSHS